ncbi:MAG: hypothetical protein EOO06_13785 [Chitinophagaceae bacterium]|nr:MAG: hypothetical protein EOO06_13785 [Chitinophagaceae bacterium]
MQPTPAVYAERVIHPEATHNMLVGDTQTNTGSMAEYLEEKEVVGRPKWVWAAVSLFLVGTVLFVIYLLSKPDAGFLGNSNRIAPATEPATYNTSGNK